MKIKIIVCCALAVSLASTAFAGDVGININLNVGNRRPALAIPAPPVPVVVVPAPPVPTFAIPRPPVFLVPPGLGVSVAIDIPYDMVFIDGDYYVHQGNEWHRGHHYNGPWTQVKHKHLPGKLRKYQYREIVAHRDREAKRYHDRGGRSRDRDHRAYADEYIEKGRGQGKGRR
jgi:hypothetical protein